MRRQGPTLRLLVVCDECAHLYCKDALGKRNPYAARCQALHGKNGEGDRHIIAGHFPIITPNWCQLRAKADEVAAVLQDEAERQIPTALPAPEPVAKTPDLVVVVVARPDLRSSIRRGTL